MVAIPPRQIAAPEARTEATRAEDASAWLLERDDLRLDLAAQRAFVDGRPVALTPSEHRILALLVAADDAVSRREIVERLWGEYHASGERAVEVHISNLRKKLEPQPRRPTRLLTVRGVGYRFARQSEVSAALEPAQREEAP